MADGSYSADASMLRANPAIQITEFRGGGCPAARVGLGYDAGVRGTGARALGLGWFAAAISGWALAPLPR